MSNLEINKKIVYDLTKAFSNCDIDAWATFFADDVVYAIMGHSIMSKRYSKTEIVEASRGVVQAFPGGVSIDITGITAEGNRVAMEGLGTAKATDGRDYNNEYHIIYVIKDGKVREAREYLCTKLVDQLLT